MRRLLCGLLGAIAIAAEPTAAADGYPLRPLRLIVPYSPGGGTDAVARIFGQQLAEQLRQPVIVENRPGADAMIGTEAIAKGPADGYTIGLTVSSAIAILPHTRKQVPYDPFRDFAHIAQIGYVPVALAVRPSVPANSVAELLALARARPGQLTYASVSEGARIAAEIFKLVTATDIVHVPYKGTGAAMSDVMSGQVTMVFAGISSVTGLTHGGKLKTLAVSSQRRTAALPSVQTMQEAGLQNFDVVLTYGISAPRGLAPEALRRLSDETRLAVGRKEIADKFVALGVEPATGSSEEYVSVLRSQFETYNGLLPRIGLKAE